MCRLAFEGESVVSFHRLNLTILPDTLAVCRLEADAAIPAWATTGNLFSITRTSYCQILWMTA